MRKIATVFLSSVILVLALSNCEENSPVGPDDDPPASTYELTVNISPGGNAGSVVPGNGTYDANEQVTLTATSADGWQFENWSGGGVSSTENPYQLTMDRNTTITANFSSISENFILDMDITDGVFNRQLILVSDDNGSANPDFDQSDVEGPPIAPADAFFVGSLVGNMNLYKDVRPTANRIVWTLRLFREEGKTITLNNFSISKELNGRLMLVDDPDDTTPNVEINLQTSSGYTISDASVQYLYVIYQAPEAAKMIAGDIESGVEIEEGKDDINDAFGSTGKGSNTGNVFRNE